MGAGDTAAPPGDRARLIHLLVVVLGVLGAVGGAVDVATDPRTTSRVLASLTVLVGLGCLLVARRVKSRVAGSGEILAVAVALTVLALVETVVASSPVKLFGLIPPAALVLLVVRMSRDGQTL